MSSRLVNYDRRLLPARGGRALGWISAAWLVALFIGSMLPLRIKAAIGTIGAAHEPIHIVVFAGTAFILMLWGRTRAQEFGFACAAVLMGAVIEVAQHVVFGNGLEWADLRADAIGVLAAWAAVQVRPAPPVHSTRSVDDGAHK